MKLKAFLCEVNFLKNLLDFTPGLLFIASTQNPESSAKHGTLNFCKPYFDLIFAFLENVLPISAGSLIFLKEFKFC